MLAGAACRAALLALGLSGSASHCGDPRDIELPLPSPGDPIVTPTFARAPAQAFTNLGIQSLNRAEVEACPLDFALTLGSSWERIDANDGAGGPVRDGEGALVQCRVRPRFETAAVYDVELMLEHGSLPRLTIAGPMSDVDMTPVTLQVTMPDQVTLAAECLAAAIDIQPGRVSFRLGACAVQIDGVAAAGCDVTLSAGFENCAR